MDARLGYGCFGQASTHRPTIPERSPVPSQVPAGDEGTRVAGSDTFANKFLDATVEEVAVLRKAGSLPILMDGLPVNAEFHGSSP